MVSLAGHKSGQRRRGIMALLIEEAVRRAKENGASVVEAYPVDPDSPGYRFCGFVPISAAHGFEEIARLGKRRHIMRRATAGDYTYTRPVYPSSLTADGRSGDERGILQS